MMVSKRNLLFQGGIFRFHVKLQGCISFEFSAWKMESMAPSSRAFAPRGMLGKIMSQWAKAHQVDWSSLRYWDQATVAPRTDDEALKIDES